MYEKDNHFFLLFSPFFAAAQIGIKAGLNFANVSKASSINSTSKTGFLVGLFLATPGKKIIGSKTELQFSRQGYDYKTSTNTGNVKLDYLLQTRLLCINITKFVQLQFGAQTAILISANADSTKTSNGSGRPYGNIMDFTTNLIMAMHWSRNSSN